MNDPTDNATALSFELGNSNVDVFFDNITLTESHANSQSLEIFEIQGAGMVSPFVDQTVTTKNNIVTAVAENGFFIQTPADRTDTDAETSDGLFVFIGNSPSVAVGELVDVTGRVMEFFDLTEISSPSAVTVNSSGNSLPPPVEFSETRPSPNQPQPENELERFEGMLVQVENGTTTGPSRLSGNVRIVAAPNRTFRERGIAYPGLPSLPRWDGNPEVFELDPDGLGLPDILIPAGAAISLAKGVLSYRDGRYQLLPGELNVETAIASRPVRKPGADEFTIATQNIEWFMDDEDDPNKNEDVVDPAEFAIRLSKISRHVREVLGAPDILAVQEIEGFGTLQKLATKIKEDDPEIVYTIFLDEHGPFYPGSYLSVGFLVLNTVQVDSVVQVERDASFEFDGTEATHLRPPFVLYGAFKADPPFPITVMGVHNKSLGGIEGSRGDLVRTRRFEEAVSIARWIQQAQEQNPDIHLVVTGDFNAFQFTDGYVDMMGQITGTLDPAGAQFSGADEVNPDLTNHIFSLPPQEQYSFVFDGNALALDHMLTSQALEPFVSHVVYTRGNADAPELLEEDGSTSLRISDHDGLVLFLNTNISHVEEKNETSIVPSGFGLSQNYPNPFNPETTIEFSLPKETEVTVKIFNLLGEDVRTLVQGKQLVGRHRIVWDGKDNLGQRVASGVYLYKLEPKDFIQIRKMVFLQ